MKHGEYMSVQMSPDGEDYVTDYCEDSVSGVWSAVGDQGSRWYFYPLPFVVTAAPGDVSRKRIVSACEGFEYLEGLTVKTAMREIAANDAGVWEEA